jgi:hypothetical protein
MYMSFRYMTPPFAEELGSRVGCAAERQTPLPIYLETDERAFQGVCCVCYMKK